MGCHVFLIEPALMLLCGQNRMEAVNFFWDVNLGDVFSVLISGGIALWLGVYITRQLSEQRFLKEFVLKDVYMIEEQLDRFEEMIRTNQVALTTVFYELHNLRCRIKIFEQTIQLAQFSRKEVDDLNRYHAELYELAARDGTFGIQSNQVEMTRLCNKFVIALRRIIVGVNNQ
jgi:hypothetical protein